MHQQFVRVFSEEDRDALLNNQFVMLFSDDRNGIYVFVNPTDKSEEQAEAMDSVSYMLTNELSFYASALQTGRRYGGHFCLPTEQLTGGGCLGACHDEPGVRIQRRLRL